MSVKQKHIYRKLTRQDLHIGEGKVPLVLPDGTPVEGDKINFPRVIEQDTEPTPEQFLYVGETLAVKKSDGTIWLYHLYDDTTVVVVSGMGGTTTSPGTTQAADATINENEVPNELGRVVRVADNTLNTIPGVGFGIDADSNIIFPTARKGGSIIDLTRISPETLGLVGQINFQLETGIGDLESITIKTLSNGKHVIAGCSGYNSGASIQTFIALLDSDFGVLVAPKIFSAGSINVNSSPRIVRIVEYSTYIILVVSKTGWTSYPNYESITSVFVFDSSTLDFVSAIQIGTYTTSVLLNSTNDTLWLIGMQSPMGSVSKGRIIELALPDLTLNFAKESPAGYSFIGAEYDGANLFINGLFYGDYNEFMVGKVDLVNNSVFLSRTTNGANNLRGIMLLSINDEDLLGIGYGYINDTELLIVGLKKSTLLPTFIKYKNDVAVAEWQFPVAGAFVKGLYHCYFPSYRGSSPTEAVLNKFKYSLPAGTYNSTPDGYTLNDLTNTTTTTETITLTDFAPTISAYTPTFTSDALVAGDSALLNGPYVFYI